MHWWTFSRCGCVQGEFVVCKIVFDSVRLSGAEQCWCLSAEVWHLQLRKQQQ